MTESGKTVIGFLGLGNIGAATYRLLQSKMPGQFEVKWALVRDPSRPREGVPDGILTADPAKILNDPQVDIVVEVLGGVEPAASYLLEALNCGKTVVTANKAALASRWTELGAAARQTGAGLYFEAACCAGIPVIRAIQGSLQANRLTSVAGIVNGTTNFILCKMQEEGLSYDAALAEAQRLGLAEPDPTADVQGIDAANKLSILLSLMAGGHVPVGEIHTEGITKITRQDVDWGLRLGFSLKLLALGRQADGGVQARVHPAFIPAGHPLASVGGSYNAVYINGDVVEDLMFYGKGAGQGPTASGLISDIANAAATGRGRHPLYRAAARAPVDKALTPGEYFLRMTVPADEGAEAWLAGVFEACSVQPRQTIQGDAADGCVTVAAIVENTRRADIEKLAEGFAAVADKGCGIQSVIRIEREI